MGGARGRGGKKGRRMGGGGGVEGWEGREKESDDVLEQPNDFSDEY